MYLLSPDKRDGIEAEQLEPYCPLLTAVEKDSIEIVQYLLEQKANPNIVSKVYKYTRYPTS